VDLLSPGLGQGNKRGKSVRHKLRAIPPQTASEIKIQAMLIPKV